MKKDFYPEGILLDVDGTLVDKQRQIAQLTVLALLGIARINIPCGVCTGRHFAAIKEYILPHFAEDALHITAGGGEILSSKGKLVWQQTISPSAAQSLIQNVESLGGALVFGQGDSLYCSGSVLENLRQHPWHIHVQSIDKNTKPNTALISVVQLNDGVKMFIESLSNLAVKLMGSNGKKPYYDITALGVNKATTAAIWCQTQLVQLAEVMAIGDDANDKELLAAVGCGVAMAHAPEEIKAVAKKVIKESDEQALARFLINNLKLPIKH